MDFRFAAKRQQTIIIVSVLLILALTVPIILTIQNNSRQRAILEESVEAKLVATCITARDDIDINLFKMINSETDIHLHQAEYDRVISQLRVLRDTAGATYIYALKEIDGKYWFIFDTDEKVGTPENPIVTPYELAQVHIDAFGGQQSASISNVEDKWGHYSTGAIPLYDQGHIVGIISADFEDTFINRSKSAALLDSVVLIVAMVLTLGTLLTFIMILLRKNRRMEEHLFVMANHDAVTHLLNRNYLFSYFTEWSKSDAPATAIFAALFIDIDNFKRVNDNSGHDAGDELLLLIAQFLKSYTDAIGNSRMVESMTVRIGGDEFLMILPGVSTPEELESFALTILNDFSKQVELKHFIKDFDIGLSIGGALFSSQATDYNTLIKLSDIAMYKSKFEGKNSYNLYNSSMGDHVEGVVLSVRERMREDKA